MSTDLNLNSLDIEELAAILSNVLKEHRMSSHISLNSIAEKLNLSETELEQLEAGQRKLHSLYELKAIQQAYGMPEQVLSECLQVACATRLSQILELCDDN